MATVAIVSFRLGGTDGVAVVARTWHRVLTELGHRVITVAGEGPVDVVVDGLAIGASQPPDRDEMAAALAGVDITVVENLCTIPLNLPATRVLAETLAGRAAVLHHHDPPWQRARFAHISELPPEDPEWHHVTINEFTRREFEQRGMKATTIFNAFDPDVSAGDRETTRELLGVDPSTPLLGHPVRAIARKNIPAALELATALDATYWLMGPAEEEYTLELEELLDGAKCRTIHLRPPGSMADAYAASDLIVFPSTWEGFGNPPIEAALHRRPAVVGRYPAAVELRSMGFRWLTPDDVDGVRSILNDPDQAILDHNRRLAVEHFGIDRLRDDLYRLFEKAGWLS